MIPALLLAALASADPAYDRLFGSESAATSATAPAAEVPAGNFAWPALLAGGGIAAAWQLRKKALNGAGHTGMRVIQRQMLGDKNALLLVEVDDAGGGQRRLLLGSSATGLALVQDLGPVAGSEKATIETFTGAIPEIETAAPPVQNVRPSAAQVRGQAAAFAEMLDEVMVERGIERNDDEAVSEAFFTAGTPVSRQRFFTEDDLAPEVSDEAPPVVQRRVAKAAAPREFRPAPPAPVPPVRQVVAAVRPAPIAEVAVAANTGLRAILGGRNATELPPNTRIVSSYGTTRNNVATAPEVRPHSAPISLPEVAIEAPAANVMPVAPIRVGPPLQNPILLVEPVQTLAPRTVSLPPAPAPTALDASRARLQRLAQAVKPAERPADLDNLVRRFDAIAAGGRR